MWPCRLASDCAFSLHERQALRVHRAACLISLQVNFPVLRTYLHDDTNSLMMTPVWTYTVMSPIMSWMRQCPISSHVIVPQHELNIIFHCPIFYFTLQAKLIFPLVNLDVNSPWDKTMSHFPPACWKLVAASSITNNDHLIITIILIICIIMTTPYSWLGMTYIPISKPSLMATPLCPNVFTLELVQTIHRHDITTALLDDYHHHYHYIAWWIIIIIITNTLLDE